MNKALISIGTNVDRKANLALCHELLNAVFPEITYSDTSITTPYGNTYKDDFLNQLAFVYTLAAKEDGFDTLFNPNSPKVVINKKNEAIYFSRSIVPYIRDTHHTEWLDKHTFYKHIGMYAYRSDVLAEITKLSQSSLEKAESLEQLRWIENGYCIRVGYTTVETIGIDTPEDMEKAIAFL